ncbi:MAG: flagellar basal-body rod protein FlgB [Deltaproteobacteria bacterium RBG_13_58_19]|nr:MAG: flagellar basal-body rod protein FlgB [Deltaproteobacteria bacterium RBG_13_58_19]
MDWGVFNDDTIKLLERTLSWQSRRQEIIASNMANLETPQYTRKALDFQDVLQSYLQGRPGITLASTNPRHLPGGNQDLAGATKDTGGPVDLDEEMVQMAQNQIGYQTSVQMINKKLDQLRTAMDGGK